MKDGRKGGRKERGKGGGRRGKIIRQNKIVPPYLSRFYYLGV